MQLMPGVAGERNSRGEAVPSETSGVMWSVSANEQMAARCPSRWAARLKSDRLSIAAERCNRRTALILECPATAMGR